MIKLGGKILREYRLSKCLHINVFLYEPVVCYGYFYVTKKEKKEKKYGDTFCKQERAGLIVAGRCPPILPNLVLPKPVSPKPIWLNPEKKYIV